MTHISTLNKIRPAIASILLQADTATSTTLHQTYKQTLPVSIPTPVLISAEHWSSIKRINTMTYINNTLTINDTIYPTTPADDYPILHTPILSNSIVIPSNTLLKSIVSSVAFTHKEQLAINCVHIATGRVLATDSFRMIWQDTDIILPVSISIPVEACKHIIKLIPKNKSLTIGLANNNTQLVITWDTGVYFTNLTELAYPNHKTIIECITKDVHRVSVERYPNRFCVTADTKQLIQALKQLLSLNKQDAVVTLLINKPNTLTLQAHNNTIPITSTATTTNPVSVSLNTIFLLDWLKHVDTSTVTISSSDGVKILLESMDYNMLVMAINRREE